jgi:uncharacterized SAM-binding protein YcdF (DUF218 family)
VPQLNEYIHHQAKIIWNYHQMHHTLEKSDGILVLGSNDVRVAEYAAQLFLKGWAPLLIFSGGLGNFTLGVWNEPEAVKFANIARAMGVPPNKILTESNSTNTGENIRFSKKLLEEGGTVPKQLILVQKPFMERRTYATVKVEWPELPIKVTSPPIPYAAYPNAIITAEGLIHAMIGDLQRIIRYPEKGFQIPQPIPEEVMEAYEYLIAKGFTQHLMPD